jgi:hypothetical protein
VGIKSHIHFRGGRRRVFALALGRWTLFFDPFGFPSGFPVLYVHAELLARQRSQMGFSAEHFTLQR